MPKVEIDPENSLLADPTWVQRAERNPMVLIYGRVPGTCELCISYIKQKCANAPPEWKTYKIDGKTSHACKLFELDQDRVGKEKRYI